ncbi:MAG: PAS domain S-box protein [Planctomycetes bacterium]|nr:PAS domain S-box protein [Planctomycetota bacterium]
MSTPANDDLPLRESEQKYRRLVEGLAGDYLFYTLDPDGRITYVSPSVEQMLGVPPDSVIGTNWRDRVGQHSAGREQAERAEAEAAQGKSFHQFTVELLHNDGATRLIEVQQRALFGTDGKYLAMEGIAKDITDLKHAADRIRKKEAQLAHVSRLATMGALVAGIAHEVHQPLHAAKTFAEAARRNLEAGHPEGVVTAIDCTKEISEAITRTAKIIRHLRAFTSAKPAELELLDINHVVQEAAEIIAYDTRRAGVRVRFELAEELLPVQGDRMQLEQACVNLLINAQEAMDQTPIEQREVFVSTRSNGQEVEISFRDRGCGVEPGDQAKMFDAFYSTKPNGMGMGLSLCKSIAESHGGHVQARPHDGPGMTFAFSLPISKSTLKKPLP